MISAAIEMLSGETEEDFEWAFRQLDELLRQEQINPPKLIVTDRDRACLNAVRTVFPGALQRLCIWHMNKDVKAYTREKLGMDQDPITGQPVDNEKTM